MATGNAPGPRSTAQYEFVALNDYIKPVNGLYLTRDTLDGKLFTECIQGGVDSWSNFAYKTVAFNQLPGNFPLVNFPLESLSFRPVSLRPPALVPNNSRRRAPQPVRDARPFRRIRRRFDDDQLRARRVAAVQLRVKRPRKRLRVVRNHAHVRRAETGGNFRVRDDKAIANCELRIANLRLQIRIIVPVQNQQFCLWRIMFRQQTRTAQRSEC